MVPEDRLALTWPHVHHFLRQGREATGHQFDELGTLIDISKGCLGLWVVLRDNDAVMAMTTRLIRGTEGLLCYIVAIGGSDMPKWLSLWPQFAEYLKQQGCVSVRLEGRVGWEHVLPEFERIGVILEKRI